ncbi:MAG: ABC transporter substrate-binding protein [Nanoarchaeota archaeon]
MRSKRMRGLFIVFAVMTLALSGCASQKAQDQVKIGGLFGLTGFASFAGQGSREGFLMAIEDSGMNVSYQIEDYGSDFKSVATSATKLIEVDGVDVLIGPEWEFGGVVVPIVKEKGLLAITPWNTAGQEWVNSPYYLSISSSYRPEGQAIIEYMASHGLKKVALLYEDNEFSLDNMGMFKEDLATHPEIEVVADIKTAADSTGYGSQSTFKTEIEKIGSAGPDSIYAVLPTDAGEGALAKQVFESGIKAQLFIPFARGASDAFRVGYKDYLDGVIYPAAKESNNMAAFKVKYKARYGKEPSALSAAGAYDATTLVLKAIKSGAKTPEEIRQYLMSVKDYEGYSNTLTFKEGDHHMATEIAVLMRIGGARAEAIS